MELDQETKAKIAEKAGLDLDQIEQGNLTEEEFHRLVRVTQEFTCNPDSESA